ncbi:enoyl-CoA hydratase/isomerase family protein [Actibacterium sp. 188UL27-1]|uniref:enoyl-CoA hydratase/isomerase family protein n=1 Tax=Actibacterium sp. 188UL27-1 TaxID=2786961 RepID=UPI00195CC234|nr:enoyl-CoA hydratase/isomerase family protein [Actibacterium sp. 188UL27-1]MBM7069668.1 enoyl-CoA hydratase/isomerase family protein [Actibacterium sp. 188UL27-1]
MNDIHIRQTGAVGHITLNRPDALNALTHQMCLDIDGALKRWADDDGIALLVFDAMGDRAFCSGGDIAEMYATGKAGDYTYGRRFWRDEYRMNARLFSFPKPVVSFLQGYTMGGGVGVGCHGSHRIVCETSRIAMPECGIGLVPDVGGSLILARAPGYLGEYLGTTAHRMGPSDAILAGFADYFVPQDQWDSLKKQLLETADLTLIDTATSDPGPPLLDDHRAEIDDMFGCDNLASIANRLSAAGTDFADETLAKLGKPSPLAMACAIEVIRRVRGPDDIRYALEQEYRFTFRSAEHGEFIEGIRAAIIDKDKNPHWHHDGPTAVPQADITKMLLPLGESALTWED